MNVKMQLTRAERVRLRRAKEKAGLIERTAQEVESVVPLVATRPQQRVAKPKKKAAPARTGSTRSRFHVALPSLPRIGGRTWKIPRPRFRFRAPRIPRPRVGWRLISFLAAAALGACLYLAFNRPEFRVTEARVIGNQLLTPAEINAVLNLAGKPIFLLTPADLETRVRLNFPELVSVRAEVALPNLVSIQIVERLPIIRWEQGGGYTWISEDGVAFKPRGELSGLIPVLALSAPSAEAGSVPPVSASENPLTPAPFISSEMVQALQGLAAHVPPNTPILYDTSFGFGWNDPRGWRVYFGTKASDVELKIRVYETMVESLAQRGIRPALINVTYPTAPYYRMSQ